jgi:thiamine kinase-like enzyme
MNRREAYGNFILSEKIANYAKESNIPVCSSIIINNNFLNKYKDHYYIVYPFLVGTSIKDTNLDLCAKIGKILASLHSLDISAINLTTNDNNIDYYYDWDSYINNDNFNKVKYRELYLDNYKKYYSILNRVCERYNESFIEDAICHNDLDLKNVMLVNNEPVLIDWECAKISSSYYELLEVALSFSGFLSNNFDKEKFCTVFKEYSKYRSIENDNWYSIICGNLINRFNWLKYNIERSLGIVTNDKEEKALGENEVEKTINEINRYLYLVGDLYDIICSLNRKENKNYDDIIERIIDNNSILKGKSYELINSGFTNTIYKVDNYIVRLCTYEDNEKSFSKEIDFYSNNNISGIPKLYIGDTSKSIVPYFYQIEDKINGVPLYEVWYKLDNNEKEIIIDKIINILKEIHKDKKDYEDTFLNDVICKINSIKDKCSDIGDICNDLITISNIIFKDNKYVLIHGDLHFDNFLYDGENIYLLDFERITYAPLDYDFKIISCYSTYPYLWASAKTDIITVEDDYKDVLDLFLNRYEELNRIPNVRERLDVYKCIEILDNYKNTKHKDRLLVVNQVIEELKNKLL